MKRLFVLTLAICVTHALNPSISPSAASNRKSTFSSPMPSSLLTASITSLPSLSQLRRQKLEAVSKYVQSKEYSKAVAKGGNGAIESYRAAFVGNWDAGLTAVACTGMTMMFAWISAQPSSRSAVSKAKIALLLYALWKVLEASYLATHGTGGAAENASVFTAEMQQKCSQFAVSNDGETAVFALLCALGLRGGGDASAYLRAFTSLVLRDLTFIAQSAWVLLVIALRPLLPSDAMESVHDLLFNATSSTFACDATELNMSLTSAPSELVAIIGLISDSMSHLTASLSINSLLMASAIIYLSYYYVIARGKRLYGEPVVRSLLGPVIEFCQPILASATTVISSIVASASARVAAGGSEPYMEREEFDDLNGDGDEYKEGRKGRKADGTTSTRKARLFKSSGIKKRRK